MVGALRSPWRPAMPIETGPPSVKARTGLWHVAQATVPSPEARASKKSFSPRATLDGERLPGGMTDFVSAFLSVYHLAAWAGVCPGSHESAGRQKSGRARKGNIHLRTILVEKVG